MSQTDQWETRRVTFAEAQTRPSLAGTVQEVFRRLESQGLSERDFKSMSPQVQEAAWDLAIETLQEEAVAEGRSYEILLNRTRIRPSLREQFRAVEKTEEAYLPGPDPSVTKASLEDTVMEMAPTPRKALDSAEHPQRLRRLYEGSRAVGKITQAVEWLRAAALAGDAMSQAELADMYVHGKDVEVDLQEAARWRRLVSQASVSTIQRLPEKFREEPEQLRLTVDEAPPEGLPKEFHRVWRSAQDGCAASQAHMAGRFARGDGVKQDWKKAAFWHERAAASGLAENQYRLGLMYLHGRGVDRDVIKAAEWFTRAKDNPSVADAWATDTARMIRASAALELSQILLRGDTVAVDAERGIRALEDAERAGSKAAADELGRLYFHGKIVARNVATAVHWFKRGAEGDDAYGPARLHLAKCYWAGEGVKRDYQMALKWMKAAAESNGRSGAEALYLLGWFHEKGIGVSADVSEALKWYYKAASVGHTDALKKVEQISHEMKALLSG